MPEFILLVEGLNDAWVLQRLAERSEYKMPLVYDKFETESPGKVLIIKRSGFEDVLDDTSVRLKGRGSGNLKRLGIVVDADQSIQKCWSKVRQSLLDAGYQSDVIPDVPDPTGTIIEQAEKPLVGIWIMPNNSSIGELEDFLSLLVRQGDPIWKLAGEAVDNVQAQLQAPPRFSDDNRSKAHIHTWLAWQKEPGHELSYAILQRYLDPGAKDAAALMDWLRQLFGIGLQANL